MANHALEMGKKRKPRGTRYASAVGVVHASECTSQRSATASRGCGSSRALPHTGRQDAFEVSSCTFTANGFIASPQGQAAGGEACRAESVQWEAAIQVELQRQLAADVLRLCREQLAMLLRLLLLLLLLRKLLLSQRPLRAVGLPRLPRLLVHALQLLLLPLRWLEAAPLAVVQAQAVQARAGPQQRAQLLHRQRQLSLSLSLSRQRALELAQMRAEGSQSMQQRHTEGKSAIAYGKGLEPRAALQRLGHNAIRQQGRSDAAARR